MLLVLFPPQAERQSDTAATASNARKVILSSRPTSYGGAKPDDRGKCIPFPGYYNGPFRGDRKRDLQSLFGFAQGEFAGHGAAFVIGLHHHGRIGQSGFIYLDRDLGIASGIGNSLSIERSSIGAGEAESETRLGNGGASLGDVQLHGEIPVGMNGGGVLPLHIQLLDGGQGVVLCFIQNSV